jgi:dihydroorotate dehydrogenase (fumarate)
MEDAGAAAIVMHSLFEEQLQTEQSILHHHTFAKAENSSETIPYFSELSSSIKEPEEYLNHIAQAKRKISIPVIASLNSHSMGGWIRYAKQIQQAGADALELNIYDVVTDADLPGEQIEQVYLDILKSVKATITIPVAVKLSPYFTNMTNFARQLDSAGVDALVLFNRFYQPDLNLETLEVEPKVLLSTPQSMRLPLRWIAILYSHIHASLAATSGIYSGRDVLKLLMVGADVTMLCSVLLQQGIDHISIIEQEMREWMAKHNYHSIQQLQGTLSLKNCSNPGVFERAQYMRSLQTYNRDWLKIYKPSSYFG